MPKATDIRPDLQKAVSLHQSGQLKQAKTIYQQILEIEPGNADILHLLGLISYQSSQLETAIALIERALDISPNQLNYLWNLAKILRESSQFQKAIEVYHQIIQLQPQSANVHYELAETLQIGGQLQQAVLVYQKVISIHPDDSQVYGHLAMVLLKLEQFDKAMDACQKAIQILPENFQAYNTLGNVYKKLGRFEEAIQAYRQVLSIQPKLAETYSNLGDVFKESNRFGDAMQAYQQAIEIKPDLAQVHANMGSILYQKLSELDDIVDGSNTKNDDLVFHDTMDDSLTEASCLEKVIQYYQRALELNPVYSADVCNNLGVAYAKTGRFEEAIQQYNRAIDINPKRDKFYGNLGHALYEHGRPEEAMQVYHSAIDINPEHAEHHRGYSHASLLTGNLLQGWKEYEWRWKSDKFLAENKRVYPLPLWDGSSLCDKSIWVWLEQGVGDQIMFASLLPELQQQAKQVVVEIEYRLFPIFQRSFCDIRLLIAKSRPHLQLLEGSMDFQSPVGSLAQWFLPDEESFPKHQAYLKACPKKTQKYRTKYQQLVAGKLLIGISWKSTRAHKDVGRLKSTFLHQWIALTSQEDCLFINLQYGDVKGEICEFFNQTGISIYQDEEIDSLQSLDDFASQIAALDLVISTSNTTVHMAGALGKPVWTLLHYASGWRWQLDRLDTPWYPSMTLYRQPSLGDWYSVFQQVQPDLKQFVKDNIYKIQMGDS